jgi:hypothetical protein
MSSRWLTLAAGLLTSSPLLLEAQTDPNGGSLSCAATASGVALKWNIAFLSPIQGWLLSRDGQKLASLDSGAQSYLDANVPPGDHVYLLSSVSLAGEVTDMAKCQVTVPRSSGLQCSADGGRVHLAWDPILLAVVIQGFQISRDGAVIATVPPSQLSYDDGVYSLGEFQYHVEAVLGDQKGFGVGDCLVKVDCFGIGAQVDGNQVTVSWPPLPLAAFMLFVVSRDGQVLARTHEIQYVDKVDLPGSYLYSVWTDCEVPCGVPSLLVGSCRVQVGVNGGLPAPEGLVCKLVDAPLPPPVAAPPPPDGTPLALAYVLLTWKDPVVYDKIVIQRNGMVIASLPGTETAFRDKAVAGGVLEYGVYGVTVNDRSDPALCKVEAQPDEVPPPQGFTCSTNDIILQPGDPDANGKAGAPAAGAAPFLAVVLQWWNPISYVGLVVLRDGQPIAKLPGDAMVYRDIAPAPGKHLYGIFGVAADGRQSSTSVCEILVGSSVPPVEGLTCGVEENVRPATVDLSWKNGVAYEVITVARNGQQVGKLPGDSTGFKDPGLNPGVYLYEVVGYLNGGQERSAAASCQVEVGGTVSGNLLYFSSGFMKAGGAALPPVPAVASRIICLADTTDPVQGWSFGVQSDPKYVTPLRTDLQGTATAALNAGKGPGFISVNILESGVTMAVVVDEIASLETLPAGTRQPLLNIEYGAGPSGAQGEVYPVRYSDLLGTPAVQVLLVVKGFEVRPSTLPGLVSLPGAKFIRGDVNGDGVVDVSDPTVILNWLFLGAGAPACIESADANDTRVVNIADPIYIFNYLFTGGSPPPWPFPACGEAPAPLGCAQGCP